MNISRLKLSLPIIALLLVSLMLTGQAFGQDVTLTVNAPDQSFEVGDTFDVTVDVSTGGTELVGVTAFIEYDPAILQVNGATGGGTLNPPLASEEKSAGVYEFTAGLLNSTVSTDFSLATFQFEAIAGGTSDISISGDSFATVEDPNNPMIAVGGVSDSVTVNGPAPYLVCVNAGGPEFTASDSRVFAAANNSAKIFTAPGYDYEAATLYAPNSLSSQEITNTDDDVLYRTERWGGKAAPMIWNLDVPASGNYDIDFYFAEVFQDTTGKRVFDVAVEGSTAFSNVDLVSEALILGAANPKFFALPTQTIDDVNVTDGAATITFTASVDNAKVSALCVRDADGQSNSLPSLSVADQTATEGDTVTVTMSATDADSDTVSFYSIAIVNDDDSSDVDPANYSFDGTTLTWNTIPGDAGSYTATVVLSDGVNLSTTGTFAITLDELPAVGSPPVIDQIADVTMSEGETQQIVFNVTDADGDALTITDNLPAFATVNEVENSAGNYTVTVDLAPQINDANIAGYDIVISADDSTNLPVEEPFTLVVNPDAVQGGTVLFRVNAGGPLTDVTPDPDWAEDQKLTGKPGGDASNGTPSPYVNSGDADTTFGANFTGANNTAAPNLLFSTERFYNSNAAGNMQWDFPVAPGVYRVNVYLAEVWTGAQQAGVRVFDIEVEGSVPPEFDGVDQTALLGWNTAGIASTVVTVNDTNLDVDFLPEVQNPSLKGIEIVQLEAFSNVPPTITEIADLTLSETQTETITFDVSDLEGDAVTVNFINLPGFVTEETPTTDAGVTTYTLTVAPQASDAGTYPVQVIASDGTEVTEDFTITVEDFVNTPPTITAIDDLTLFETQTRTVTFDVADIDGDDVTVSVTDLSFVSGGANAGAGTYTLTIAPADGDAGTYPVMVTASDGVEVTETFNITVEDNDIPAGTVLYRVNVGGPQLDAEDGSSPVWSKDQGQFGTANNSPYLIANSTGGSIYNGNNGSAHGGSIVMTDPSIPASAPPALFNLERYNNQTNNPAGQQWEFPVVEGTDVVVRLFFAELFGGVSAPGERVFDVFVEDEVPPTFDDIDQIAIAGPKGAFMREATVTVGSDGILNIVMLSSVENPALKGIEIAIPDQLDSPVNTAPVAVADSYTTDQNVPLTVDAANGVLANDTDTENDTLTAIATGGAAGGGTLTLNADGSFTYTPPSSSFTGDATFFYKANDGELDSSDAAITITVTPNAFPVAESDSYTTFVNQDLLVEAPGIFANDSDDTVSLGLVSEQDIKTKGGSLILGAGGPGGFLLEVPQDYTGTLTWQYVPQDERGANGRGNIVTVTIEVLPAPNVAPVADAGADITVTDTDGSGSESVTLDGSGSTDTDGTISTYSWSENDTEIATGIGPSVDFNVGTYVVTLTVTDDDGATATDTVTVVVNEQGNNLPVITTVADQTLFEYDTLSLNFSATDADNDDITLAFSLVNNDGNVAVPSNFYNFSDSGDGTGNFSWQPQVGEAGIYTATLTANDGKGSATETFTITVQQPQPNLTIISPTEGTVINTAPGESTVDVTVTWTLTDTQQTDDHVHLYLDDGDKIGSLTGGTYTLEAVSVGAHTLVGKTSTADHQEYTFAGATDTVNFTVVATPQQYTLTANAGTGGTVSDVTGAYADGTQVEITATPDEGYQFTGWTGDIVSSNNPLNVTMGSDITITANFEPIPQTIYMALTPADSTVDEGTNFDLDVMLYAGDTSVAGSEVMLNFDSSLLSALEITPGTAMPIELDRDIQPGSVSFVVGSLGLPASGDVKVATVTFEALNPTASTTIAFDDALTKATAFTANAENIVEETQNATVTITDVIAPELVVSKVANPSPAELGASLTYTITVENTGDGAANNVLVTDDLDANLAFVSVTPGSACAEASGTVTCNFATIAGGAQEVITIATTVTDAAQSFVQTATNSSPFVSDVTTNTTVPADFELVSSDGNLCTLGSTMLTCVFADVQPQTTAQATVYYRIGDVLGEIPNTVTVEADNDNGDSASITTPVGEPPVNDPPVVQAFNGANVTAGETVTIDVTATDEDEITDDTITLTAELTDESSAIVILGQFTDNGDGTGQFVWDTTAGSVGTYTLTVTADDGVNQSQPVSAQIVVSENEAPTLIALPNPVTAFEDDLITVDVTATDTEPVALSAVLTDVNDVEVAKGTFTDNQDSTGTFEWQTIVGDAGTYTLTIIGNDTVQNSEPLAVPITIEPKPAGTALALVEITPNSGLGASTFGGSSIQITNQSTEGVQITGISIDLSTGMFPDMVFDPVGAGGDATASCFTPNSGATAVGLVAPTDPCVDPFSAPRFGGFDVMTLSFTEFDPTEQFFFTTDVDPNSIKDVPGAGNSGAVSGLELIGSTITMTFSTGETYTASLYEDGSLGGGQAIVGVEDDGPSISVVGVETLPATVSSLNQTITITGEADKYFSLMQLDTRLFISSGNPPFNVADPTYYANEAMAKAIFNGQLDSSGTANVPVTLLQSIGTPPGGLNYFIAVESDTPYAVDQPVSSTSNVAILKYDPTAGLNPPVITAIPPQASTVGDEIVGLQVQATDADGDILTYQAFGLPTGLTIDPNTGIISGTIAEGADALSPYNVSITVTDDSVDQLFAQAAFQWTINPIGETNPGAQLTVNGTSSNWFASTFSAGSLVITNTGDQDITSVTINMDTAILTDIVFDPVGSAGDSGSKCLIPDGGAGATGYVTPANNCTEPFSAPNNGVDNDEGFDAATVNFTDFNPGETFSFAVDIDPTTIKGDISSGNAGSISGFEMVGSTVTVQFADDTTLVNSLWENGSNGGSTANVVKAVPSAPIISAAGVSAPAVVSSANQTINIVGPANTQITLLQADGRLQIDSGQQGAAYDVDPFEANELIAKVIYNGTTDGSGNLSLPVTLLETTSPGGGNSGPNGGINHFIAVASNGNGNGSASNVIVLELGEEPNSAPQLAAIADQSNEVGDSVSLFASATDADQDTLTYSATGLPLGLSINPATGEISGTVQQPAGGTGAWIEQNGLLVIEMESAPNLPNNWETASTYSTTFSPNVNNPGGAAGDDFIIWQAGQALGNQNNGQITYPIQINTPGTYQFQWRNQVGNGTNTTEHNDTWLKIEADAFFGSKNGGASIVCPKGLNPAENDCDGEAPDGAGGNGYFKIYSSGANNWSWGTSTSDFDAHAIFARFDAPGTYNIMIAARSNSHAIDRMILFQGNAGAAQNLSNPESPQGNGSINETYNVTVGVTDGKVPAPVTTSFSWTVSDDDGGIDPVNVPPTAVASVPPTVTDSDGDGFAEVALDASGSDDSDGNVVSYSWSDGNSVISTQETETVSLPVGTNNLTLTVTDNDGATAIAQATVVVQEQPVIGECSQLVQEAETADLSGAYQIFNDNAASGGQYINVPNSGPNATGGPGSTSAEFCFTVPADGTYTLNGRVYREGGGSNSFWVQVNGSTALWDAGTTNDVWFEDEVSARDGANPVVYNLTAGEQIVTVYLRENGARLDWLELVPQGVIPNFPPVADAGDAQTIVDEDENGTEEITLDGTGSTDSDGSIVSYSWTIAGNQVATGATPTVNLSVGQTTLTLTVTDDEGATATDSVVITVLAPAANQPPIANAGNNQTVIDADENGTESVTLDGTASSDSDGTIVSYMWMLGSSQIATGATPTVDLPAGQNTLTLTVTDDDGASDTDIVQITVQAPAANQPPVANAGNNQTVTDNDGNGSESVTLNGSSSSDNDGNITSYVWTQGGNQIATGATPSVTLNVGSNTIVLTVTDDEGATATDEVTVVVEEQPVTGECGLVMQGEDADLSGGFTTASDGGDTYIVVPDNSTGMQSGPNNSNAVFCFDVPAGGTYTLQGRVYRESWGSNSFYVSVNGGGAAQWQVDPASGGPNGIWFIDQVGQFNLSAGEQTLTVYLREDGARIDYMELVPVAAVPAEFSEPVAPPPAPAPEENSDNTAPVLETTIVEPAAAVEAAPAQPAEDPTPEQPIVDEPVVEEAAVAPAAAVEAAPAGEADSQ